MFAFFALYVRSSIFTHVTSSVSNDVISKTLKDILVSLNFKFHLNRLVKSRDIDVLILTDSRILIGSGHSFTQKLYVINL